MLFRPKVVTGRLWFIRICLILAVIIAWRDSVNDDDWTIVAITAGIIVPTLLAIEWWLRTTYYVVERGELMVRSGFSRHRIPFEHIQSLTRANDPKSLDRALPDDGFLIRYTCGEGVIVSPADHAGFIATLTAVNPRITLG